MLSKSKMVFREINWDSTAVVKAGKDDGFDKGKVCSGKLIYNEEVSELDDSLTDSFSHSFSH